MTTVPRIPETLAAQLGNGPASLVYSSTPETATWRLENGLEVRYLKVSPVDREPSLASEFRRMRWAHDRGLPVPRALGHGVTEGSQWLLTAGLPGRPATDEGLVRNPANLVKTLAHGLCAMHETPASDCPFHLHVSDALTRVRRRAAENRIQPDLHFHAEHRPFTVPEAVAELERCAPETEDLVLCHGDYCLPNVLVEADRVSGYVDLGELGVADRWWDLAVASWSVGWNLGVEWETSFFAAYGIDPDPARIRFFRLLYDLHTD